MQELGGSHDEREEKEDDGRHRICPGAFDVAKGYPQKLGINSMKSFPTFRHHPTNNGPKRIASFLVREKCATNQPLPKELGHLEPGHFLRTVRQVLSPDGDSFSP
jgi:hypothetical protein